MKPNIFDYATKELSQDAFFAWLLKWADEDNAPYDPNLNLCAREFISLLTGGKIGQEVINKVDVGRQWQNIDIWAEINDKYLIIIEDKTNTGEHSDQLRHYKEAASKWCKEHNYEEPICVFLKTGNESIRNFQEVESKGYKTIQRNEILTLLKEYPQIGNGIYLDFLERMERVDNLFKEFEKKNFTEWKSEDWAGFYKMLDEKMGLVQWGRTNNFRGGFNYAVLNWKQWGDFPIYLQIEEGNLCIKVSTNPEDTDLENVDQSHVRNSLYAKIVETANRLGMNEVKRPDRFGKGTYMTAAYIGVNDWLEDTTTDAWFDKTVTKLKKYDAFLEECLR